MKRISSTEAVRGLSDYLAQVKYAGETFLICKNDQPVATLAPIADSCQMTLAEFVDVWKSLDFDDTFADDLETVGREDTPLRDPWDS